MYTHALNPVIFSIGPVAVRWYGLVYALGFLLAYYLLQRAAATGKIKNLDPARVDEFLLWFIALTIITARLFYVLIYNPLYYVANPLEILALWHGGLSFHGGLLGAAIAGFIFTKRYKIPFYGLADLLVIPFALVLVFGRIANFINGELPGRITDPESVPWCVAFPSVDGAGAPCRHPSQLYEALKNLIVFLLLIPPAYCNTLKKRLKPWFGEGSLFWLFVLLYGLGRFITDFWRAPDPTDFTLASTGLLVGQWLSLIMVVLGLVFLLIPFFRRRRMKTRIKTKTPKRKSTNRK